MILYFFTLKVSEGDTIFHFATELVKVILIFFMLQISGGDSIFLYAAKLMSLKDLGSIVHPNTLDDNTFHSTILHWVLALFIDSISTF